MGFGGEGGEGAWEYVNVIEGHAHAPTHLLDIALFERERGLAQGKGFSLRAPLLRERGFGRSESRFTLAELARGVEWVKFCGLVHLTVASAAAPTRCLHRRRAADRLGLRLGLLRLVLAQHGPHGVLVLSQLGDAPESKGQGEPIT